MTLYELIQANPDGFTFDLKTGKMATFKSGYYIALSDNPIKKESLEYKCEIFLKAFYYFGLTCKRKIYIGGWKDKSTYYLDYTVWVKDEMTARILGKYFKQKGIYDIANDNTIYL